MIKFKIILLCTVFLILINSCEKSKDPAIENIVINELMSTNSTVIADQNGEYDDWIELYNLSDSDIDISGYYLSDNEDYIKKWKAPRGTTIAGNDYLIIWADKDTLQTGLHAAFKLSAEGEQVLLSNPEGILIDEIDYPAQTLELSYSRIPDGTGDFTWKSATFNRSNDSNK